MVRSKVTEETSVALHQCHGGASWHTLSVGHHLSTAMCIMISQALLATSTLTTAGMLCLAPLMFAFYPKLFFEGRPSAFCSCVGTDLYGKFGFHREFL